jgi:hypothetical protein
MVAQVNSSCPVKRFSTGHTNRGLQGGVVSFKNVALRNGFPVLCDLFKYG